MGFRVLGIAIALLLGGCGAGAFACQDSSECVDGGAIGTCEADGWCSFPDGACPTGQRYGGHAGDGLAGMCVAGGETTAGSEEGMTVGEGSTVTTTSTSTSTSTSTTTSTATTTTDTVTDTAADTSPATCGDGVTQAGEECDNGSDNDNDAECTKTCTQASCGDEHLYADHEVCDGPNFGGVECTTLGFDGGMLVCSANCQSIDTSECNGCGPGGCPPFGPCDFAKDCAAGDVCTSVASMTGTCLPPCGDGCPNGSFCTNSFNACALPCVGDDDCPMGMLCTALPGDDQLACMW